MVKKSFQEWINDEAPRLAAALAFYTVFSIAPLLIIIIGVAGLVVGEQAVHGKIFFQIKGLIGAQGAEIIQTAIASTQKGGTNLQATIIGFITLIVGASGVFAELQTDLDKMWNVKPKPKQGILFFFKTRFLSLGMVIVIGFLLLVSLSISAVLSYLGNYITSINKDFYLLLWVANYVVSFGVITILFAAIFKYLPDANIRWYDAWIGASVTTLLFLIGKFLISVYLANSSVASSFGAAGSLILMLLWIYYSSQILFFGAEFTKIQASMRGPGIPPTKHAMKT